MSPGDRLANNCQDIISKLTVQLAGYQPTEFGTRRGPGDFREAG